MKRLGVAVVLAGLLVIGCGDSGLVKLENKNPTIDQAKYDLYIKALNESEFAKEYDFYHISSIKNHKPIKENKMATIKAERFLDTISDELNKSNGSDGYGVFAIKKDNKNLAGIIAMDCRDMLNRLKQCENANEIKYETIPAEFFLRQ